MRVWWVVGAVAVLVAWSAVEVPDPDFSHLPAALRPHRPLWLRLAEALVSEAKRLSGVGVRWPSLEAANLLAHAEWQSGLHDWADEDGGFREALEVLGASLEAESNTTALGRLLTWTLMGKILDNRLRIVEYAKRNPGVSEERIEAPVFIVGMPRSGTSFLFNLLRQDEARWRAPQLWEIEGPVPPTDPADGDAHPSRYWRILRMQLETEVFKRLAPSVAAVHNVDALNAEECMPILGRDARSLYFNTLFMVPAYQDWLLKQSQLPPMRFHKRFLQTLQSGAKSAASRKTWLLKAPWHMYTLEDLWEVYPDARVIVPHRDPAGMIASLSSLHARFYGIVTDDVRPKEIGAMQQRQWSRILPRFMDIRAKHPEKAGQIVDVHFEDIRNRPLEVVQGLYDSFGWELDADARARMQSYLDGTTGDGTGKKGMHGKHDYELAWFGLDEDDLMSTPAFEAYCDEYDVPRTFKHSRDYED